MALPDCALELWNKRPCRRSWKKYETFAIPVSATQKASKTKSLLSILRVEVACSEESSIKNEHESRCSGICFQSEMNILGTVSAWKLLTWIMPIEAFLIHNCKSSRPKFPPYDEVLEYP
ncbi:hypothetical protein EUGRSUZ_H03178 [Eucalyptus grandis]|uniref:Uncharacterized protein n=2 Tax=Eucalyptus grandis TaxID=71139 RepID=A0ACC3JU15_EUCGR|nr:hypothetical protein EUGRSUZ_H03178 [Eucalyptus grandis]